MTTIKTHFNLSAADYEAHRSGVVEQRRHREVRRVLDHQLARTRQVLELGCGPGKFLAHIARRYPRVSFAGIDIDPRMIAHARQKYPLSNLRYELRDIASEEVASSSQFIFSIDLIHHVHDFRAFFHAVRRLLTPGGVWLAIEPNMYHPYIWYSTERMRRAGFDEDHFRPRAVEPLLRQAGFTIASRRYASLFPGWIPRLPRFLVQMEKFFENCRFLGGSVVYQLVAREIPHRSPL